MTHPLPIATFSIAATDGQDWGIAVASKFLAVGSVVPAAVAGVGAIATQAMGNTAYKSDGLRHLREGLTAAEVVAALTAADPDRDHRQLGVVDKDGNGATYTGSACFDWAGGRVGPGVACQGNILSGPEVVDAMMASFSSSQGALTSRLLAALAAGDEAGGDRRGRQSAAILVVRANAGYGGHDDRMVDLRVDDHPQPVAELNRLLRLWRLHFESPDQEQLVPLDQDVLERVRRALFQLGRTVPDASADETLDALQAWAGMENLEERCGSRTLMDPLVMSLLEERAWARLHPGTAT
jgi:uncharacterized Ntn-hydrolase superfamily protein